MTTPTSVNVNLPSVPNTKNKELFDELMIIYNAIRGLAIGVDDYTEEGTLGDSLVLMISSTAAVVSELQEQNRLLREELNLINRVVNWSQPDAIGDVTPATITGTDITATGTITAEDGIINDHLRTETFEVNSLSTFHGSIEGQAVGFNGQGASGPIALPANAVDLPTACALANACKSILQTFGLGA